MICESCRENLATVYVSEVLDTKKKKVMRLCEACARDRGVELPTAADYSVKDLFAQAAAEKGSPEPRRESLVCPDCGIGLEEFRRTGRLGCARDYDHFRAELLPLLERIHGAERHLGQVPQRAARRLARDEELAALQKAIAAAVAAEDYEEAARLRDRIQHVEGEG